MKNALEILSIILHLLPDLYIPGVTGSFISRLTGDLGEVSDEFPLPFTIILD
jgi:hypothetical protein